MGLPVVHINAAVFRDSGQAGARTPAMKSLRRSLSGVADGLVRKSVRAPPEITDLLTLFIGQDRRDFAVNFHPFNRQIGLDGGHLGRRGAHSGLVGVAGLDGRAQIFPGGVQLAEQWLQRVLLGAQDGFDLRFLVVGQIQSLGELLQESSVRRRRGRSGVGRQRRGRQPSAKVQCGSQGKGEPFIRFHTDFNTETAPEMLQPKRKKTVPKTGYNPRITAAAAFTVWSMSAAVWALEMKPASNCDGAR